MFTQVEFLSRTGRQKDNPKGVDETHHSLHQHNSSTYTVQFNKETTKTTTTSSEVYLLTYTKYILLHLQYKVSYIHARMYYRDSNLKCFENRV